VRQALMLRLEKLESKSAAIPIDDDPQIFGRKFHAALGAICAFHVAGWREPEAPLIALARALGVTEEQAQLELTDTLPLARLGRLLPTVDAPPEIPLRARTGLYSPAPTCSYAIWRILRRGPDIGFRLPKGLDFRP
jgi:hypothetical protein